MVLFGFYSSCEELQSWLEKQTALFQTLQPEGDNLEVTQLKYEVQLLGAKGGLGCISHAYYFTMPLSTY